MVGREGKWRERSGGIVCWQQIVLGGLDKWREGKGGKGSGGIVRHLLRNIDYESEAKTI